jgi:hypothetical protein
MSLGFYSAGKRCTGDWGSHCSTKSSDTRVREGYNNFFSHMSNVMHSRQSIRMKNSNDNCCKHKKVHPETNQPSRHGLGRFDYFGNYQMHYHFVDLFNHVVCSGFPTTRLDTSFTQSIN